MTFLPNFFRRIRDAGIAADRRLAAPKYKPPEPADPQADVRKVMAAEAIRPVPKTAAVPEPLPPITHPAFDKAAFFAVLRGTDLRHRRQEQVQGTELLLDKMKGLRTSWVAYALATTWHETAATMQPILEHGGPAYFKRMYDIEGKRPHVARVLGNTVPGDGVRFAGRGYVQLTGRTNYARAAIATGYPLVGNPDLAMRPDIAAEILRAGMVEGWFVPGHTFARYLPDKLGTHEQFRAARRIINGTDRADKIAGYALAFQSALIGGGWK